MDKAVVLRVEGAVARPLELTFEDLAALPEPDQVPDVSRFHPNRQGDAVTLEALLRLARPREDARFLTLHAERDDFHVSIRLEPVRSEGLVVYRLDGQPLDPPRGGPIRFLIRDPAACHTDELDDCANIKYLDRIELTTHRGRDTRPTDDASHDALHEQQETQAL